jgi:adenylate cyclase
VKIVEVLGRALDLGASLLGPGWILAQQAIDPHALVAFRALEAEDTNPRLIGWEYLNLVVRPCLLSIHAASLRLPTNYLATA